jgi:acyl transferase domain-containing protein/thioesterase domain-containing protein
MSDYVRRILRLVEGHELSAANARSLISDYLRETKQSLNVADAGARGPGRRRQDIAIVGVSGRFPGAPDVRAFWKNLCAGACSVTEVPRERWDVSSYYDPQGAEGKSPCKWGGFLSGVDLFDPLFFSISGSEAELTDPQQRLFLEEAWKALEDAGYADWWLSERRCGVFVGVGAGDYTHEMIARGLAPHPYAFLGNSISVLASRISYLMNLKGPSLAVDTACSSSLVAVHLACQSITSGESELAIAGGVFLSVTSAFHDLTGRLGMLSPTGRCYAFDDAADGFVPGEAVGVVVLRPLAGALRDGDNIYAVIRASGVNQDGKTNGITAPSSISQSDLEAEVYREAGINPASISYVETHGTGTRLGDPIEIEALTRAFRRHTDRREFCAIGSAKTNIGHAGAAAGIVGLIKTLLSLKHGRLPPSLNFQTPNRHLRLSESPFYVNTELRDWQVEGGQPRRAAVSAFGLSGVNAHVVLDGPPPVVTLAAADHAREPSTRYQLITISARTQDSLEARLAELEQWLAAEGAQHSLSDIAYTLNHGRSHFGLRVAFVITQREELAERLRSFRLHGAAVDCRASAQTKSDPSGPRGEKELQALMDEIRTSVKGGEREREKLLTLADCYVRREEIDWPRLYVAGTHRRVSLPAYPFSRERYWLPEAAPARAPQKEIPTHFFSRGWQPCEGVSAQSSTAPLHVEVIGGSDELIEEVRRALTTDDCTASVRWRRNYNAPDYDELISALDRRKRGRTVVLLFREAEAVAEHVSFDTLGDRLRPRFELAARLLEQKRETTLRVLSFHWRTGDVSEVADEAEAGLGTSLRALDAKLEWRTVKLDTALHDAPVAGRIVVEELRHEAAVENEIFYDARQVRHTMRAAPVELATANAAPPIRRQGVYLITGGAGALGLLLAQRLARRYAAKVVLTGRRAMDAELRARLQELGAQVDYLAADAGSLAAMRGVVQFIIKRHGALHGVVHAAGIITPELVQQKTDEQRRAVLHPKMNGALVLDIVTKDEPLDFFALFSSLSAVVGDFGQCDYAVANRFLDGFAAWRAALSRSGRRRGRTLSINWPLWQCGGMNFTAGEEASYKNASGLEWLEAERGLDAFERTLASGLTQVIVATGERRRIEQLLGVVSSPTPGGDTVQEPVGQRPRDEQRDGSAYRMGTSHTLLPRVQDELRGMLAQLLKVRADKLGFDVGFGEFGLESINMKGFADLLGARYRISLSPTIFFEHNSITELGQYLLREYPGAFLDSHELQQQRSQPPAPVETTAAGDIESEVASMPLDRTWEEIEDEMCEVNDGRGRFVNDDDFIAIIGASGRFPQSRNLEEFWQHLAGSHDLVTEIPPERWDWRVYQAAAESDKTKSISRWGGFMPELDRFDAAFFNISPREAAFMDPQHRIFLETVWHTIEDAGYRPSALAGRRVGLFVGCQFNEYMGLIGESGEARAQAALGNTHTMLANRVSYLLDLRGASEAIDTACSSGLVALHRAVASILDGESELALAGGVSAILSPETYVLATQLGMLSRDGRCKTFDRRANGYVKGEGVGAVLLKRLSRAVADGDHVYAVVRGTAVNHGGKANSLTAPNPEAQTQLICEALRRARVSPTTVTYIEAHGTGTELGDPIEVDALRRAFDVLAAERAESLPAGQFCGIGSVKSNIGHLEPAAGIAGLLKVLLSLKHKRLPASLHVENVNPYLRLEGSPFYIVREARDWETMADARGRPLPRRAGVSSFGFGGSNAHVVLEEFSPVASAGNGRRIPAARMSPVPASAGTVVPFSARNEVRLREYTGLVAEFLQRAHECDKEDFWPNFAFTLQEGREAFDARVAFVAHSSQDLREKLRGWLATGEADGAYAGNARSSVNVASIFDTREEWEEFLQGNISKGRLDKIARLWADGAEVNWQLLNRNHQRHRLSLPTYPFARTRHWFDSITKPKPSVQELIPSTQEVSPTIQLPSRHSVESNLLSEEQASSSISLADPSAAPPNVVAKIQERITQMLATALYMEVSSIDATTSFVEIGLDSILAVEIVKEINQEFGSTLKATRLYDYPSVESLSAFLASSLSRNELAESTGAFPTMKTQDLQPPRTPEQPRPSSDLAPPAQRNTAPRAYVDAAPESFAAPHVAERAASRPGQFSAAEIAASLKEMLAATLYLDVSDIDDETKFVELGLDSILAVELVKQINDTYATNFKATRLYDHSSVRELSDYLAGHIAGAALPSEATESSIETRAPAAASIETPFKATATPPGSTPSTSIEQTLRRRLAAQLLVHESDLDDNLDLLELGFDLVAAGSFAGEINREFGTSFEGAQLLGYPNLRRLSSDVLASIERRRESHAQGSAEEDLIAEGKPQAVADDESEAPDETRVSREGGQFSTSRNTHDIAIIGMSGRFPGARNLDEYWRNLINGIDSVTEIPPSRWDAGLTFNADPNVPNNSYCRWGGFLDDVDSFDPFFFHLSPRDAEIMDPQQRLFLEEGWKALEDAGYSDTSMSNRQCAIFVGAGQGDYFLKFTEGDHNLTGQFGMGNVNSILAARLAYFMNLKGASVAVDTACSSSLVAIHLACQSLIGGESEMALAGGVFVMTTPQTHILTSQARMLSPEGKCKTFDTGADGFVPGEGVGVVLLKPLANALADGDHVHAVIRGSATNQDGKTNGMTAPSALSQTALQLSVYRSREIDPSTFTYVEAHGTGTKLGDPIEIDALTDSFRHYTDRKRFCAIGSVKTNIGHSLPAAGVAALIKVVLSLKHKRIPPSLHCRSENEHIDFADSPFYVNVEPREWVADGGAPRRAAINSFGFSGTNAHVVVEEAPVLSTRRTASQPVHVFTLSAKTAHALRQRVQDLASWLRREHGKHQLSDISYTLNAGRSHFNHRLAIIASDEKDLSLQIEKLLEQETVSGLWMSKEAEAKLTQSSKLSESAQSYAAGNAVDWTRFYGQGMHRRISLPTYPFEGRNCSMTVTEPAREHSTFPANQLTAPPLAEMLARFDGITFHRRLTKTESLVRGHLVQGHSLFAGAGFLDLALSAAAVDGKFACARFCEVRWLAPLVVDEEARGVTLNFSGAAGGAVHFEVRSESAGEKLLHARGDLFSETGTTFETGAEFDVQSALARCPRELSREEIYARLGRLGLDYGSMFRNVEWVRCGEGEAVSSLRLPAAEEDSLDQHRLHPGLLDSALHSIIAFASEAALRDGELMLPYGIEQVWVRGRLGPLCYAYLRSTPPSNGDKTSARFDVTVVDPAGRVLVEVKGFQARPAGRVPFKAGDGKMAASAALPGGQKISETAATLPTEVAYFAPHWKHASHPAVKRTNNQDESILIIRPEDDLGLSSLLRSEHRGGGACEVVLGNRFEAFDDRRWEINHCDAADFERALEALPHFDHIYFLGGLRSQDSLEPDEIERAQELSVLALFRFVQALGRAPNRRDAAHLTVVTNNVHGVISSDVIWPHAASVIGLAKVVAREYPHLKVSCIDFSNRDLGTSDARALERLARALGSGQEDGEGAVEAAYRGQHRFEKEFRRILLPSATGEDLPLRRNGVYLVVGGAGGIGREVCRFLAQRAQARIAIIGRSPLDAAKEQLLSELRAAGAAEAIYYQSDVTSLAETRGALAKVSERWGGLNGVVHSAMVLADGSLERMNEDRFRASFDVKVKGVSVLARALEDLTPDWLALFSSTISWTANSGQGNYVAASAFEDAFGLRLQQEKKYTVRILNWGYWGEVGAVANEKYRERAALLGIGSINATEGMDVFGRALAGELPQVFVLKAAPAVLEQIGVDVNSELHYCPPQTEALQSQVTSQMNEFLSGNSPDLGDWVAGLREVERLGRRALGGIFARLYGEVIESEESWYERRRLQQRMNVLPHFSRLFDALCEMLEREEMLELAGVKVRLAPRLTGESINAQSVEFGVACEALLKRFPPMRPYVDLLKNCVQAYPDVLTGRRPATDALFPQGSMRLVEGIMRDDPVSGFYNRLVGLGVRHYVDAITAADALMRPLRILEVGAGTGSTTAAVLEQLGECSGAVEYVYTDLTTTFLEHGRRLFAERYPFVEFQLLNLENDFAAQGYAAETFDLIIGANVVHATRRINDTLERLKGLMRRNGVLLLLESVTSVDFSLMTFGLTSGWWLHEDAELRLTSSPLLSFQNWRTVLDEEGFRNVIGFGQTGDDGAPQGHTVIMAESDGWVVKRRPANSSSAAVEQVVNTRLTKDARGDMRQPIEHGALMKVGDGELLGHAKSYLRSVFSEVLKAREGEIEDDVSFEDYGIDSLVSIDIMQRLEVDLGTLPRMLLFEQPTLEKLAQHLVANVPAKTLRHLGWPRSTNEGRHRLNANGASTPPEAGRFIVPVKRGGGARASYWIHGALGEISWVVRMARYMSDDCPVYALQARGLDGRAEPFESIKEMASAYVSAIREAEPHGPYVLGGYSLGGAVALEMAHQFEQQGERVSRLILLDAYAPGSSAMQSLTTFESDDFVLLAVTNLLGLQWKATVLLKAGMLPSGDLRAKTEFAAAYLFNNSLQPYSLPDLTAHLGRFVQVAHRHADALTRYEARPYREPLETTLFRSTQGFSAGESALSLPPVEFESHERDLGWGGLLPSPPKVYEVDADHFSLSVEPAIQTVAQHVSHLLVDNDSGTPLMPTDGFANVPDETQKKREIFEVIREQVLRVLGDVPREAITIESTLRALGANSIDRVEVVTCAMEALDTNIPRTKLAGINNLQSLVDVFHEHLNQS